jgi:uncharacterized protein (DUF305 family)
VTEEQTVEAINDVDDVNDLDESPRFRGPNLLQTIALVLALCFLTGVVTAWWVGRDPTPNAVDVGFFDDMTVHHDQAIGMAITYLRNGDDKIMTFIASGINRAQNGDIRQMQAEMQQWGKEGTPDIAMEWMGMSVPPRGMPGMATEAQMAELQAARGPELDDLFSRLMIDHHLGGIHMAEAAEENGDLTVGAAAGMTATQRADIGEINNRREQLGLPRYNGYGA